jgi:flagellar basal-body rod modification protein FlgD
MSLATLPALPPGIVTLEERQAAAATRSDDMGRQEFLKLLTTQLQNQNPLDPMQNEAFVAQLAQFSTLEATLRMSDSMDGLVNTFSAERMLTGASLVGKRVEAQGSSATLSAGESVLGHVSLPTGADFLQIQILSPVGELVRTLSLGSQLPGKAAFAWDGLSDDGRSLPPGSYRIEALATFGEQSARLPVTTQSLVKAVRIDPALGSLQLELDGGTVVNLNDVTRISH